jgi:hypothetical protein
MPTTYAIPNGRTVFTPLIWSGAGGSSGATRSITGAKFKPDLIWEKSRTSGSGYQLMDAVRGAGTGTVLSNNSTGAAPQPAVSPESSYGWLSSFDTGGFTTTNGTSTWDNYNKSGDTYVAWNWLGANATTSNTNGSITTQVSVNQTAGFSVIQWSGNTTSGATIGHGLGATPTFFFMHRYVTGGTGWPTYHANMSATPQNVYLRMDSSTTPVTDSTAWNNTAPSSTVITLGNSTFTNGASMICYAWTPIAGYSATGSYTGNGSSDGPFIYTGFKPAFVMYKAASGSAYNWSVYDTTRQNYNVEGPLLQPNVTDIEAVYSNMDILSNGFKIRNTGNINESGSLYVYIAFAENPFKYANAG